MLLAIALLTLPFIARRALGVPRTSYLVGFAIPKGAAGMARGAAASRGGAAGPSPLAMAAMGPAALLMTPQGQGMAKKGLALAMNARKGDPKAKARVQSIKQKAARGDPKAKAELNALKAGELARQRVADAEGVDPDELEDDYDDGDDYEDGEE